MDCLEHLHQFTMSFLAIRHTSWGGILGRGGEGEKRSSKVNSHFLCSCLFVVHVMTLLALGLLLAFYLYSDRCCFLAFFLEHMLPIALSGVQKKHPGTSAGGEFLTCLIPLNTSALSTIPGSKVVLC